MRKGLTTLGFVVLAVALATPAIGFSRDVIVSAEVTYAPVRRHGAPPPPLGRKQGWLTITNRDWQPYSVAVQGNDKIFVYRDGGRYGGIVVPSGSTVTIALEKDSYDLYGSSSNRLKVRIREGRTTTLSLDPYGYVGSTGLRGVVNDGDRVRDEVIFEPYVQTVVVRPPPPPPVIVRPPVVIQPGPPRRPPPPPPPPPGRRPPHGGKNDGWGFVFGFGSKR